jgi:hypothetical protein
MISPKTIVDPLVRSFDARKAEAIKAVENYIDDRLKWCCKSSLPKRIGIDIERCSVYFSEDITWKLVKGEIVDKYRKAGWKVRSGLFFEHYELVFYPRKSKGEPDDSQGVKEHEEV